MSQPDIGQAVPLPPATAQSEDTLITPISCVDPEVTHVNLAPISLAINNHLTVILRQRRLHKVEESLPSE